MFPAERARRLARGIRREIEPVRGHGPRNLEIDDARLTKSGTVVEVELEELVHPCEREDDTALARGRAARQARARAPSHERNLLLGAEPDDGGDLFGRAR